MTTPATLDEIFHDVVLTTEQRSTLELVDRLITTRNEENTKDEFDILGDIFENIEIDIDGDGVPDA